MLIDILLGLVIALAIIVGAIFFAFRSPKIKVPSQHNIRGNGDHASEHHNNMSGGASGGDVGGGSD